MKERSITPETVRAELDALSSRVHALELWAIETTPKTFEAVVTELEQGNKLASIAQVREQAAAAGAVAALLLEGSLDIGDFVDGQYYPERAEERRLQAERENGKESNGQ